MENLTMRAIKEQYNNETFLEVVAEYVCMHANVVRPMSDLHCGEFPVKHSIPIQLFVITAFSLLILTAVIGNSVVMWIIMAHRVMRQSFNYFLFNMAFADFLIALMNVGTSWTFNFYYDWWYGSFCTFNFFFGVTPTCVSVFTMVALSLDRCGAVLYPLRKRQISNHRIVVILLIIWITATGMSLPLVINSHTEKHYYYTRERRELVVQWLCVSEFSYKVIYDNILLFVQYIVPLFVLLAAYARIAVALRRQTVELAENTKKLRYMAVKKKVIKMLLTVVCIFMVCWLPYQLYHAVLERLIDDFELASYSYLVFYWLAMSASAYNPLIYCFVNERFRVGFRYVFRWMPCVNYSRQEYEKSILLSKSFRELASCKYAKGFKNSSNLTTQQPSINSKNGKM